jgi:hypothetical protein
MNLEERISDFIDVLKNLQKEIEKYLAGKSTMKKVTTQLELSFYVWDNLKYHL